MKSYPKFRCRQCGTVYRIGNGNETGFSVNKKGIVEGILKVIFEREEQNDTAIHQCSDRMAGVADFAGIEFSED